MNVMDDTLADESGIPFLSNTDDIPVHSTPIKGTKIPLPSTKNVMKQLINRPGRFEEYTDSESLQSIRHCDIHHQVKGQGTQKGQGKTGMIREEKKFVRKSNEYNHEGRNSIRNMQDLSDIDNLRHKSRNFAGIRGNNPERSRSPTHNELNAAIELEDVFKRPKDVPTMYRYSVEERKRDISSPVNNEKTLEKTDIPSSQSRFGSEWMSGDGVNTNAQLSGKNRSKYLSMDEKRHMYEGNDRESYKVDQGYRYTREYKTERTDGFKGEKSHSTRQEGTRTENNDSFSREKGDPRGDSERFTVDSPRQVKSNTTSQSRSLSSSKHNTSLCELENTTLQKQRQEIQLLMGELKDRDRELSDMMTSHQQQLVAWQQDRDRLVTLERKCTQHEEELRSKASQLRNALSNLKTMKETEGENQKDLEKFRSTIDRLTQENTRYKEEISQLQELNENLQENVNNLSTKVGKLEAREEELTTSLKLKEKDISSATGHMRELSERLQQLDLKCKECQDREREALRQKHEWKQKYENTKDEFNAIAGEMDQRRKETVRLAEENKSARQQLALIQKEASMMERCKDELIDSMRVKQERTDTQLRNLRELYDRQVREVASLQLQLDNSKELLYRQQSSLDDQQLSSTYQGRLSQASEFSLERSSANQRNPARNKSSPTLSGKYRETDMTGSHQHTQSSGYQSQLYENQTGNHPVPITLENNYINITGSKQYSRQNPGNNSDRNSQALLSENQSLSRHSESNKFKETDKMVIFKKQNEDFTDDVIDTELPAHRDTLTEAVRHSNKKCIPNDNNYSAKVSAHTPPKVASKLTFSSPQRHDGYIVQETTIEFFDGDIDKELASPANCCELSENALEAMRKAEKMLIQHSDTHKEHEKSNACTHKKQEKYFSDMHTDQVIKPICDTHQVIENSVKDTHKEQINPFSSSHKEQRKHVAHKEQNRQDSYRQLKSETHKEQSKPSSVLNEENFNSFSGSHKVQEKPVLYTHKEQKNYDYAQEENIKHFSDTHKTGNPVSNAHKDLLRSENANVLKKESDINNGAKEDIEARREDIRVKLDDRFAEVDHEEQFDKEFEKKYTFENKLCSFLEDLDDIDDSIWDEKPVKSTNISTTESSPASKLRKLLIESEEMIQSLEKSTDSPRQVLKRDINTEQSEKTTANVTNENQSN